MEEDRSGLTTDVVLTGFMSAPRIAPWGHAFLYSAEYDVSAYDDGAFQRLGAEIPDAFARAVPKRLAEYLAGRVLARAAIRSETGRDIFVPMGTDRAPIWPADLAGSISHSEGRALCLVRSELGALVGVDVERIASAGALDAIRSIAVSEDEEVLLVGTMSEAEGLTATFSAKEAIFKALFPQVRRFFDFKAARLCEPVGREEMQFRLTETLTPSLPVGHPIAVRYRFDGTFVETAVLSD